MGGDWGAMSVAPAHWTRVASIGHHRSEVGGALRASPAHAECTARRRGLLSATSPPAHVADGKPRSRPAHLAKHAEAGLFERVHMLESNDASLRPDARLGPNSYTVWKGRPPWPRVRSERRVPVHQPIRSVGASPAPAAQGATLKTVLASRCARCGLDTRWRQPTIGLGAVPAPKRARPGTARLSYACRSDRRKTGRNHHSKLLIERISQRRSAYASQALSTRPPHMRETRGAGPSGRDADRYDEEMSDTGAAGKRARK